MYTKQAFTVFAIMLVLIVACGGSDEQAPVAVEETYQMPQATPDFGNAPMEEAAEEFRVEGEVVEVTRIASEVVIATAPAAQGEPVFRPTMTPAATPPRDNFFEDYGVNPFTSTAVDHLSTFAIDVDTASYSVARRYVRDGLMPPADAIRVEEFVNYFNQEYPIPPDVAFAIYADGAPSPFHGDGTYILRFGIQGYDVSEDARPPASLTFVVDVSGSMDRENRLGLVKESLHILVDRLRPDDMVSIVVYGSDARVILQPTRGNDKNTILNAIYALRPEGSTNAEAGLQLGYSMANRAFRQGGINRVILASDGVANVGLTNPDELSRRLREYADGGITLTTVGFGMGNFNDVLMEQLADQGDGHYAYVDTLAEAEKLFVEDLTSTLQTIAVDAKIQVDFNPEIISQYRLIGYENRAVADEDFRNDAVDAGEIGAGHTVTALYAVQFFPGASGRIATVQLRWEDPESRQVQEINGNFNTWDLSGSFEEATPRYQLAVVVSQYAELLRNSYWSGDATFSQLAGYADRLAAQMPWDSDVVEFASLLASVRNMRG